MGLLTPVLEKLIITRPELQKGLTELIPRGQVPISYINRYQADPEVSCAFCDKHTAHKRGFTAQMADGRTALCGRDCGIKYFGKEAAEQFEKQLEKQIENAARRQVVQRAIDGVPLALGLFTLELIEMEKLSLAALFAIHAELNTGNLPGRVNDSGDLEVLEYRRRWIERDGKDGQVVKVPVNEAHVIDRIVGATLLRTGGHSSSRFETAKEQLETLAGIKSLDGWNDHKIAQMAKTRSQILRDIEIATKFMHLCQRFFTKPNVAALSRLAQTIDTTVDNVAIHHGSGKHELELGLIRRRERYTRRYTLPDFDALPDLEALAAVLRDKG